MEGRDTNVFSCKNIANIQLKKNNKIDVFFKTITTETKYKHQLHHLIFYCQEDCCQL